MVILVIAGAALLAIQPSASEPNPEFTDVQQFLDRLATATVELRSDDLRPTDLELAQEGLITRSAPLGDGTTGSVLVGRHADRCFVVYWTTPGDSGARAGVLDPSMPCAGTVELVTTLPSPPLVEVFPGTVPPISADELISGSRPPFPAERTPTWFVPAVSVLFAVVLWQLVGLTIKLLRWRSRRPRPGSA